MALVRPSQALRVPLQTKTRPRPFNNPARNASCLPDTCRALHTIAPAAHDATKVNTKNGRGKAIPTAAHSAVTSPLRREEHARGRRMAAGTKAQDTSSHCAEL